MIDYREPDLPFTQAVIQHRVVSLEHNHTIEPSLREEITAVIIHNVAPFFHQVLELITHLHD